MNDGEPPGIEERWVSNNGLHLGPRRKEGIGAEDVLVEVIQRKVALEFEGMGVLAGKFVGVVGPELLGVAVGKAAGEHQRDLGRLDSVVVDINAEEVPGRNYSGRVLGSWPKASSKWNRKVWASLFSSPLRRAAKVAKSRKPFSCEVMGVNAWRQWVESQ